jgi:hypothetical protein
MAKAIKAVSGDITIAADPAAVYALITDLDVLAEVAAETETMTWTKGVAAQPGAVFTGRNRHGGKTWSTTCTVTDARPHTAFEFEVRSLVIPVARWRYDIAETDGGCVVTESTMDLRPGWFRPITVLATGVKDRAAANAEHIATTLERLKARAES